MIFIMRVVQRYDTPYPKRNTATKPTCLNHSPASASSVSQDKRPKAKSPDLMPSCAQDMMPLSRDLSPDPHARLLKRLQNQQKAPK